MLSHNYTRDCAGPCLFSTVRQFMANYGFIHTLFSLRFPYDVYICITLLFLRVEGDPRVD